MREMFCPHDFLFPIFSGKIRHIHRYLNVQKNARLEENMLKKISESYFCRIFSAFFVSCLVFAVILSGIISFAFYRIYLSNLRQQSIGTAEKVRNAIDNEIENYKEVIRNLTEDEEVRAFFTDPDAENANTVLRSLYILKNGNNQKAAISIVKMNPTQWLSTSEQVMKSTHASFENWGVFRKANEGEDVAVYAIARDAMLNEADRICMAKAYRDEKDQVLGYVLVEIPRSTIDVIVNEYAEQYKTMFMILNQSGAIIYHTSGLDYEGLGKAEEYGFDNNWSDRTTGITDDTFAYSRSDSYGLLYIKEMPSDVMNKIMNAILKAMIPGLMIIAVLGLGLSGMLARSISAPIQRIRESMAKVKHGDLTARVIVDRKDEIGQLGESFNAMTEQIGELMANIDEEKHSLWIAETRSLSLQMNPHFLYNTLDLIKWNAKLNRTNEISDITVQLGRLLRRVMNTKADLVTVSYEMEIIRSFLEIQKKHYGDRLHMEAELQSNMEEELIPKLILQPMVENAIVHGFSGKSGECRICLDGRFDGEYLIFRVEDNGNGMDQETLHSLLDFRQEGTHHIGLNNVQRRARLFGDENCGISAVSVPGKGTQITLRIKHIDKEKPSVTGGTVEQSADPNQYL